MKTEIKLLLSAFFLGLTVYQGVYLYRTIPSQFGFSLAWQPESNQLEVIRIHPSLNHLLEKADIITDVNGVTVTRYTATFPTPKVDEYTLKLLRDGRVLQTTIHPVDGTSRVFTDVYAALIMWSIGTAILFIGKDRDAYLPAIAFMLTGAGWLSIAAFQLGEFTAWLLGYVFVPIMGPIYAQLGLILQGEDELATKKSPRWLSAWFILALGWSVLGAFNYLYLFPHDTNWLQILHVEWLTFSYLSVAVGFLCSLGLIIWRAVRMRPSYIKHQLTVLVVITSLGVLPFVLFTIVPRLFGKESILAGPIGFTLLLFLPLGYLFITLRRQHLFFELATSRILLATLLIVTVIVIFSVIRLNLLHKGILLPREVGMMIVIVGLIGLYPNSSFLNMMRMLLYGKNKVNQYDLQIMADQINKQPRWHTVNLALLKLSNALELENILLYVKGDNFYALTAFGYACSQTKSQMIRFKPTGVLPKKLIRIVNSDALHNFSDNDIFIPIMSANILTGFLIAKMRPKQATLNESELVLLKQVATILSSGIPAISAFEAIGNNHVVSLYSKELERQRLATEIHDGPLQDLLILNRRPVAKHELNNIIHQIRQICHDLYNPVLDDHVEYVVKDILRSFRQADFAVQLHIQQAVTAVEIDDRAKIALYYVLKEAMSNVANHAEAHNVTVTLGIQGLELLLSIEDNGKGFYEYNGQARQAVLHQDRIHQGLRDMYYWASLAKGKITMRNKNPTGWRVQLLLPILRNSSFENMLVK